MPVSSPQTSLDTFTPSDLAELGEHLPDHWVRSFSEAPALQGQLRLSNAPTGIHIHTSDVTELENFQVSFVAPAGLKLLVQLEGITQFRLGNELLRLSAEHGPTAFVLVLQEPTQIIRMAAAGTRVRKLVLTLPETWFETGQDGLSFASLQDLLKGEVMHQWQPSFGFLKRAAALVEKQASQGLTSQFEQNSLALSLIGEAVAHLEATALPQAASVSEGAKVEAAMAYVAQNLRPDLTTDEVARAVGVSQRVLERLFRQILDKTIGEAKRELGLQRAYDALALGETSVAQAAYLAGYGNPSSFAVAFQRAFEVSPSQVRP